MRSRGEVRSLAQTGKATLKLGKYGEARAAFVKARHTEGLIDCGNRALKKGECQEACDAFAAAGHKTGLVDCGERALENGFSDEGRKAFAAAGVEMPKDRLVTCGVKALENGWSDGARAAFRAVAAIDVSKPRSERTSDRFRAFGCALKHPLYFLRLDFGRAWPKEQSSYSNADYATISLVPFATRSGKDGRAGE